MVLKKFKLIVIGGGTSGLRLALNSASRGYNTALIEPGLLGGTCLNTGCIPTKALLHSSHLYKQSLKNSQFGIKTSLKIDLNRIMKRAHSIINEGQIHIKKSVKKFKNLTIIRNKSSFIDGKTILAGNEKLTADKIVICTGAKNFVPPIKGLDKINYLDNSSILKLKKLPKSIIWLVVVISQWNLQHSLMN